MRSRLLIVGAIFVAILGTYLYNDSKNKNNEVQGMQTQATESYQAKKGSGLENQTKTMGAVEVEITPINLVSGQNIIFKLSLNTHSVELDYDYTQILSAEDNNGNIYRALGWSGGEGGHHLSGEVELEPLSGDAQSVKLSINGIDNQKTTFEWEL